MKIRPKNWSSFQHYKDRSPTWIKLHKALLDNYEFQCLPVASRALAPMLWLLASEDAEGVIDADERKLAFRLRTTPKEIREAIKPLIDDGFFECVAVASDPLAETERIASPEKENKGQVQTEEELMPVGTGYSQPFEEFWLKYPRTANMPKKLAFDRWKKLTPDQQKAATAAIPGFKRYCEKNAWYQPIYADRFLSQGKFEGYAPEHEPTAEEIETAKDRADKLMRRGKYAEQMQ